MKTKNVLGIGLGIAALYFLLNTKKPQNNGSSAVDTDTSNPSSKANYAYYSAPKPANVPSFTPDAVGFDGTPYKQSALYFGDKTQPYDSFFDYSDDLGRLYLGYINSNKTVQNEDRYNAIRMRIRPDSLSVKAHFHPYIQLSDSFRKTIGSKNAEKADAHGFYYLSLEFEVDVFNPFKTEPIRLKNYQYKNINFCGVDLDFQYMPDVPLSQLYVMINNAMVSKTDDYSKLGYLQFVDIQKYSSYVVRKHGADSIGFMQNPFPTEIGFGYHPQKFTFRQIALINADHKTPLDSLLKAQTGGAEYPQNFSITMNLQFNNWELKYPVSLFLEKGKEPAIMPQKFWQYVYTNNSKPFIIL